jgi:GT2 family glycosyltransferase
MNEEKRTRVVIALPWYTGPDECTFPLYFNLMSYFGAFRERTLWRKKMGHEAFMKILPDLPPLDETKGDEGRAEPTEEDWENLGVLDLVMCNYSRTSLVGRAREHIAEEALKAKADYIFWWDDDMKFEYSTFLRLWRRQVPAVAALAFTARHPVFPVIYQILVREKDTEIEARAISIIDKLRGLVGIFRGDEWDYVTNVIRYLTEKKFSYSSIPVFDYKLDSLMSGEDIGGEIAFGAGVMLTNCDVFRKVPQPWFASTGCGEDWFFCTRMMEHKVPRYVDTSVKTYHREHAPRWINEESYWLQRKTAPEAYEYDFPGLVKPLFNEAEEKAAD